jgi:hypothetical protein
LWHVLQPTGDPAAFSAMWGECDPAMFGYAVPAGARPSGGTAWQEVQLAAASGDAATWHAWQTGPAFADGAETSWQGPQLPGNVARVTV